MDFVGGVDDFSGEFVLGHGDSFTQRRKERKTKGAKN
jgi:hypothetical protein